MFLKRAVKRHYESQGSQVNFPRSGVHVGNCLIDGEVRAGIFRLLLDKYVYRQICLTSRF